MILTSPARNARRKAVWGPTRTIATLLLTRLSTYAGVFRVHYNRPLKLQNYRNAVTTGASLVRTKLGYTGAGVGIAVIDSGIAWHDDLVGAAPGSPYGNQRVTKFVDFV